MRATTFIKALTAAALAAVLVVPAAGQANDGTNERCENPRVELVQPQGGQAIVNGAVVTVPGGQSMTLSTTGTIEVKIKHVCAYQADLVVTKTGPGAPAVIHTNSWSPLNCEQGDITDTVKIGLDGGSYQFDVSGLSCDGRKLRSDGHGGTVIDPPLPGLGAL